MQIIRKQSSAPINNILSGGKCFFSCLFILLQQHPPELTSLPQTFYDILILVQRRFQIDFTDSVTAGI